MKKQAIYGLLISLLLLFIAIYFYKSFIKTENYILIDNPTTFEIKVELGGSPYVLAPWQSVRVQKPIGGYKIKLYRNDSLLVDSIVKIKGDNAVINPTFSDYYIAKQYYGRRKIIDSLLTHKISFIDGKEYRGDVKKNNNLYIDDFYLNLEERFPKIVKADSILTLSKIFRESQFQTYYNQNYQ